jgi:hypothetical protein
LYGNSNLTFTESVLTVNALQNMCNNTISNVNTVNLSYTAPFAPTSVGNCVLWLDGSDTTTMTLSNTSNVTAWRDKSAQNYLASNFGVPTYVANIQNSRGVVSLGAVGRGFSIPSFVLSPQMSVFMVQNPFGSTNGPPIEHSSDSSLFPGFLAQSGISNFLIRTSIPAPVGLAFTQSGTTLVANWTTYTGAINYTYTVYSNSIYATPGTAVAGATGSVGTNTFTFSSPVSGTYYYFTLNVTTSVGTSQLNSSGIVQYVTGALPGIPGSALMANSTQYIAAPNNNSSFAQNVAFTNELWFYPTSTPGFCRVWNISLNGYLALIWHNNRFFLDLYNVGTPPGYTSQNRTYAINNWYHLAVSWNNASSGYLFVNGVVENTFTGVGSGSSGNSANPMTYGKMDPADSLTTLGYYTNIRVVKGVAVYTGAFTPPTAPLNRTQSSGTNISAITAGQTQLLLNTYYGANFLQDAASNFTMTNGGSVQTNTLTPFLSAPLPPSPANLEISTGTGTLSWTAASGATSYAWTLYNNGSNTSDYVGTQVPGSNGTTTAPTVSTTVSNLVLGSNYYYTVSASNASGVSPVAASPIVKYFPNPYNLTLAVTSSNATLNWLATGTSPTFTYTLFQTTALSSGGTLTTVSGPTTTGSSNATVTFTSVNSNYYYYTINATTPDFGGVSPTYTSPVVQYASGTLTPTITNCNSTAVVGSNNFYYFTSPLNNAITTSITNSAAVIISTFVLGGGGGGGTGQVGGGGGAGGLQTSASGYSGNYSITIGGGGNGGTGSGPSRLTTPTAGSNSLFAVYGGSTILSAYGGGVGATYTFGPGGNGGCGGGGAYPAAGTQVPGNGTAGQGYSGGTGGTTVGGGGGGIGGVGSGGSTTGNGGYGYGGTISSTFIDGRQYGGGGGGGNNIGSLTPGAAYQGGGAGGSGGSSGNSGSDGTSNTGGGGGGGGQNNATANVGNSGNGGSGIVILYHSLTGLVPLSPNNPSLAIVSGTATMTWTAAAGATSNAWILYRSSSSNYAGTSNASGATAGATATATATGLTTGYYWYFAVTTSNSPSAISAAAVSSIVSY